MMTYISPKSVAMQGLRTRAMSNNVVPSRNGAGVEGGFSQH